MKTRISKAISIIFTLLFILSACKKEDIIKPTPRPTTGGGGSETPPGIEKAQFRFSTSTDFSGQPYHSSNLTAVISIRNDKNEEVIKERVLTLTLNGTATTQSLELPAGNYKLTSFRLEYGNVTTHFAAPLAGSAKASLVQKALPVDFKIDKGADNNIAVEILKVLSGEKPLAYGYPSGAFDHGQADADPYMSIKLRAIMKIGDVVYDSVPASLTLTTYNANGERTTTYSAMAAGVNEVKILKSAAKYTFLLSKWGTNDEMALNRQDVKEDTVYTLGGSKAAKKLKSERKYKQVNGIFVAEGKTDFFYDADGKLSKIEYWLKKADNSNYLTMSDRFVYSGTSIAVTRFNEETGTMTGITAFVYDNRGRVIRMSQKDNGNETNATVDYYSYSKEEVKIHYEYPGKNCDMNYYMTFHKGNVISGSATSSNHNTEQGLYSYDMNINPYLFMNWPDLFLSHTSKNNITWQSREYYGSYPVADPYSFNYTYDSDGYPIELIKHFRSYPSGNFAYSTKTVFVY
jgi:hypothetical protein